MSWHIKQSSPDRAPMNLIANGPHQLYRFSFEGHASGTWPMGARGSRLIKGGRENRGSGNTSTMGIHCCLLSRLSTAGSRLDNMKSSSLKLWA